MMSKKRKKQMKKLMTIAAVALCGAAMAGAVESSNIVG